MPVNGINDTKGKGFDNCPENINRKWRPRKTIRILNEVLMDNGLEQLSNSDATSLYGFLLNADRATLERIKEDKDISIIASILAKQLLSSKGWEIMKDILDRIHWKAIQKKDTDNTGDDKRIGSVTLHMINSREEYLEYLSLKDTSREK